MALHPTVARSTTAPVPPLPRGEIRIQHRVNDVAAIAAGAQDNYTLRDH